MGWIVGTAVLVFLVAMYLSFVETLTLGLPMLVRTMLLIPSVSCVLGWHPSSWRSCHGFADRATSRDGHATRWWRWQWPSLCHLLATGT